MGPNPVQAWILSDLRIINNSCDELKNHNMLLSAVVQMCLSHIIYHLRNRKHFPCFHRLMETGVMVLENEKCVGNTCHRRVFPQYFRVLSNLHEGFYNSMCKATVIERDGVFTAGQAVHNHSQAVGTYTAVKIISTVKRKAVADVFKPASAIVDEVMTQYTTVITQFTDFFFQASLGNCI